MIHAPKSSCPIRPLHQATGLNVTTLNAIASSYLPAGFGVEKLSAEGAATELYIWTGTEWEDGILGGVVTNTIINGPVCFINPSSTDISFTW